MFRSLQARKFFWSTITFSCTRKIKIVFHFSSTQILPLILCLICSPTTADISDLRNHCPNRMRERVCVCFRERERMKKIYFKINLWLFNAPPPSDSLSIQLHNSRDFLCSLSLSLLLLFFHPLNRHISMYYKAASEELFLSNQRYNRFWTKITLREKKVQFDWKFYICIL